MQEIFVNVVCAIICGVLMYVARELVPYIKAKLSSTKYSWAADIVDYTVRAYEQMISGHEQGNRKFAMVLEEVKVELAKHGIILNDRQISVLIEASVQAMNAEKIEAGEICEIELPEPEEEVDEQTQSASNG